MPRTARQPDPARDTSFDVAPSAPSGIDVVVRGVGAPARKGAAFVGDLTSADQDFLRLRGFAAGIGECVATPAPRGKGKVVVWLGLGARSEQSPAAVRRAVALAARAVGAAESVALDLFPALARGVDKGLAAHGAVEGWLLATHRAKSTNKPAKPTPSRGVVIGTGAGVARAVQRAQVVGKATRLARDLVGLASGELRPPDMIDRASAIAAASGLELKVWSGDELAADRLNGLIAVGKGSDVDPCLIRLTYEPAKATRTTPTVVLVGKGITFDSGGLSLKPAAGMETMRMDKGGACAVLATMSVIDQIAPAVRVVGYLACAENMPSGSAQRPGDVITYRDGTTVEVLNTDAEGRLVLADALLLAAESKPAAIIDLATLTGACLVALGPKVAGLFSNDDELATRIEEGASGAGEALWRMPLVDEYRKMLDSPFADMKNIGGPYGGTITAALFLREFVGTAAWAHLDIAGPAWSDSDDGELNRGATGWGVRTLLNVLERWS